ncbi:MAG: hypothetical protein ACHQT7_02950 [Candidatus Levyibacteriota bacterium]
MAERNFGFVLLSVGLLVMVACVIIIIMTFIGSLSPIALFNIPAPSINTSAFMPSIPGLPKAAGTDIQMIPTKPFNDLLNLGIEFMLMSFIMSFGFKLADLGVKLVRPIKITAKE